MAARFANKRPALLLVDLNLPFRVPSDATAAIRAARKTAALTVIRLGMPADTRGVGRVLADL